MHKHGSVQKQYNKATISNISHSL